MIRQAVFEREAGLQQTVEGKLAELTPTTVRLVDFFQHFQGAKAQNTQQTCAADPRCERSRPYLRELNTYQAH